MRYRHIVPLFFCLLSFNICAKNLTIGTLSNDPPFEYQNGPANLSGFDIDIMNRLCKLTKNTCTFKIYNFHKLFGAIENGEIDLAIAAIIITPERKKHLLFSLPYKFNYQQFVILADSPLNNPSQLRGKTVGVYATSPEVKTIHDLFEGQIHLKMYEHVDELVYALKKKRVAAIVLEYPRAMYWLSNTKDFKLLGRQFRAGQGYGIIAKLGQTLLIEQINRALEQMEQDDSYLNIYRQYF